MAQLHSTRPQPERKHTPRNASSRIFLPPDTAVAAAICTRIVPVQGLLIRLRNFFPAGGADATATCLKASVLGVTRVLRGRLLWILPGRKPVGETVQRQTQTASTDTPHPFGFFAEFCNSNPVKLTGLVVQGSPARFADRFSRSNLLILSALMS